MRKALLLLSPVAVCVLAVALWTVLRREASVRFADLEEAKARAEKAGLKLTPVPPRWLDANSFYASTHVVDVTRPFAFSRDKLDADEWRGVAFIGRAKEVAGLVLSPPPEHFRAWGEIAAFGDPEILALIETSR